MDIYNATVFSSTSSNPDITNYDEAEGIKTWARRLNNWGLASLASEFLESSGAFATLAAQSLYVCQPLLEPLLPVRALAKLLEDPERTKAFIKILRKEAQ